MLDVRHPHSDGTVMTFEESDRTLHTPYDYPLVIDFKVANTRVKRVLVNSGSSPDIITLEYPKKLK